MLSSTACIARKLSLNIHLKFYIWTAYTWCSYISTYLAVCTGISLLWKSLCATPHWVERCVTIFIHRFIRFIFSINNNSVHENIILKIFYAWTHNGLVNWDKPSPVIHSFMLNGITLSNCLSSLVKICLEILCSYQLYPFKIIVACCCHTSFSINFESEFQ